MKPFELALLFVGLGIGVAVGTIIMQQYVSDANRIAIDAQRSEREWKRLFCETSEGKMSMVCERPGVVRPNLKRPANPYRQLHI